MKTVLAIITGFWLGLCLVSALRAQALLNQPHAPNFLPRILSNVPRHTLALPPAAAALLNSLR